MKKDRNVLKVFLPVCHIPIVAIMNDKNVMKRIIFRLISCSDCFGLLLRNILQRYDFFLTSFVIYQKNHYFCGILLLTTTEWRRRLWDLRFCSFCCSSACWLSVRRAIRHGAARRRTWISGRHRARGEERYLRWHRVPGYRWGMWGVTDGLS